MAAWRCQAITPSNAFAFGKGNRGRVPSPSAPAVRSTADGAEARAPSISPSGRPLQATPPCALQSDTRWQQPQFGPPGSSPYKQSSWTQRCRPESDGDESDAIPFQTRAGEADPGRISSQRDVMTPEAEGSPGRNTT
jgi:hypothetical protein